MTKNAKFSKIFTIIPFILILLLMLPRLASSQFGLLDDPATLARAQSIMQGDFDLENDLQAGRFRPLYWLFPSIIYFIAGAQPIWFFFGFLLIFLILLYKINVFMKKRGAASWQICLTSILFIFSIPIIENFYTLSKGEPLQLLFIFASLISVESLKSLSDARKHGALGFVSFLCILCALMVKETTMVLLPISILWLGYVLINKNQFSKGVKKAHLNYGIAVLLAVIMVFGLRMLLGAASVTEGSYSYRYQFSFSDILMRTARWMTLLAFYFHYLLPLILALILVLFVSKKSAKLFDYDFMIWAVWSLLWLAVLIPWGYAEAYYLLPFSIGIAIWVGLSTPNLINTIVKLSKYLRRISWGLIFLSMLLFISTFPNYYTHAKMQLTFDQMNQQMLTYVAEKSPLNNTVLINIETPNEYTEMIGRFLNEQSHREDIQVDVIDSEVIDEINQMNGAWVLLPRIENQPRLTVRVGVEERFQSPWNEKFLMATQDSRKIISQHIESFRLFNVNLPVIVCPLIGEIGFCEFPDPLIDARLFTYGWEIYQIK